MFQNIVGHYYISRAPNPRFSAGRLPNGPSNVQIYCCGMRTETRGETEQPIACVFWGALVVLVLPELIRRRIPETSSTTKETKKKYIFMMRKVATGEIGSKIKPRLGRSPRGVTQPSNARHTTFMRKSFSSPPPNVTPPRGPTFGTIRGGGGQRGFSPAALNVFCSSECDQAVLMWSRTGARCEPTTAGSQECRI